MIRLRRENNLAGYPSIDKSRLILMRQGLLKRESFFAFARHGRALTGVSPKHAQIVGSV